MDHRQTARLVGGGSYRQQRILLNAIRFLANDLKLTLIRAGKADAKRALATERQLADRFRPRRRTGSDRAMAPSTFRPVECLRRVLRVRR